MGKPRVFSGMRPTGRLQLGNYFGALKSWVDMQDDYECYFGVVDWHALTTGYEDTSEIRENTREMVIDWLSAGLDPEKSVIIRQSDIKEHAELQLLFSMITPLGWLERCPTYKEQLHQLEGRDIMTYGFLGYPVLMAADILAYKAEAVPVGEDQLPHVELTREIARRFNFLYKPVFPEPQALLNRDVTLLPGIDGRKMSKSYGNYILMSAEAKDVEERVGMMVTDPERIRRTDPGHPDVCTVYAFHKVFSKDELPQIEADCTGARVGCVECKRRLARALNQVLEPIREKRRALMANPDLVEDILRDGARKARAVAGRTLEEVRSAMRI
ncbi:MAG TPA: tryptophan--tRNA ligase [Firmicutes bacterium]|nr:tryptophan--tRNA ligase [Bacillota bacterium]